MSVRSDAAMCHALDVAAIRFGDTPDAVRARWLELRAMDDEIADANKSPNQAIPSAVARYRLLDDRDRRVIDQLLSEQSNSTDEDTRFVALALVEDCRISSATDALNRLKVWLDDQSFPGAPYEVAKIDRILGTLAGPV